MQTYQVTLHYTTKVVVNVCADDELTAREIAVDSVNDDIVSAKALIGNNYDNYAEYLLKEMDYAIADIRRADITKLDYAENIDAYDMSVRDEIIAIAHNYTAPGNGKINIVLVPDHLVLVDMWYDTEFGNVMFETEDGDTMSLDDFGLAETLVILNDLKEQFQSNKHSIKISQTSINNFKEHQAYEE